MTRLAPLFLSIAAAPALALDLDPGTEAQHEALRALKTAPVETVNAQDFDRHATHTNTPFRATVVTRDHYADLDAAQRFYDGLFTRKLLTMGRISFEAEAEALSMVDTGTGTVAVTTGTTVESYTLADGHSFDIDTRWTARSVEEPDGWRLAACQSGMDFLDNPVLRATGASVSKIAALVGAAGLVAGFIAGWLVGRRRRA